MKKILGLWLAVACCACSKGGKDEIVVRFEVDNMTYSQVGLLIDRTTSYSVGLDKNGRGEIVIPGMENLYAHVVYGEAFKDIFLQKGERATVRFDARRFGDGVQVEGRNPGAAEYLQSVTMAEPPSFELPWPEFKAGLDKRVEEGERLMAARGLDGKCPYFAAIERERLRYLYAQSMIVYPIHRQMEDPSYLPGPEYYDAIRELVVERRDLADVEPYRVFMNFGIAALLRERGGEAPGLYERTLASMRYVAENFTDEKVKQTLLRVMAMEYVFFKGVRNTRELRALVDNYITDERMLREVHEEFARRDPKAVGRRSPDFAAEDAAGAIRSLDDFQGKYLYIDLWATWCGPCRAELPHLKALAQKFAGRNIVFLGLSVDKDRAAWEEALRSGELPGTQLLLGPGSDFQQDYEVEGIPRFILLDPEGRIVDPNMLRPSSGEIERVLGELEGI